MANNSLVGRSLGIGLLAAVTIGAVAATIYAGILWLAGLLIMAALGVIAAIAARSAP